MSNKLVLEYELPNLNEIIAQSKQHWSVYAGFKKKWTRIVKCAASNQDFEVEGQGPWDWSFNWFCSSRRKDPDGIMAGAKYIFDGLIEASVIENDGWKQVESISHEYFKDKENPRVEVIANLTNK